MVRRTTELRRRRWADAVVAFAAAYAVMAAAWMPPEFTGGITLLAALSLGVPAAAFLVATPFLGVMPRPEEEARAERAEPRDTAGPGEPHDPIH